MAKTTKKKVVAKTTGDYSVTLTMADATYTGSGDNLQEVLLSLSPVSFKAKGVFVIEKEGKKMERVFNPKATQRIVSKDINAMLFAKLVHSVIG